MDDKYTINDGLYLDFSETVANPKHLQFKYFINNVVNADQYEGCNIRLTNYTIDQLQLENSRTNGSDPLFFRIQENSTITLNYILYYSIIMPISISTTQIYTFRLIW